MGKKNIARKLRRHPELANQIYSSAAPSQIPEQYRAALEDLPDLLKETHDGQVQPG